MGFPDHLRSGTRSGGMVSAAASIQLVRRSGRARGRKGKKAEWSGATPATSEIVICFRAPAALYSSSTETRSPSDVPPAL